MSEPADALFPERFVPGEMHGLIEVEHLARYHWASACVSGRRVLDAGCGNGYGSLLLHKAGASAVTGVDIAQEAIDTARAQTSAGVRFVLGDISALPFEDDSFDAAVCFEAIEHVHDQARTLDELRRVLSATGLLIVSSPNRDVYQEGNPFHTHEYTPEELRSALAERFANVRLERQQAWLLSMVCDDELFGYANPEHPLAVEVRKVAAMQAGRETFTLALASDAELPAPAAQALVTDPGELDAWRSRVHSAEEHLERSRGLTAQATAAYGSAQAAYVAAHADYEHALAALETSLYEQGRSEEGLQRANTLLAERNAALRIATEELVALRARQAMLAQECSASSASLATLTSSKSWRLTAPLRAIGRAVRGVRPQRSS
jgi:SAM-dependent methyltransferase